MGKSSRLSFSESIFHALRPLDRIHCDLWGPAPFVSVQGFKYYAVFVDNHSRYCWFYPMRLKSEFYSIFVAFQNMVEKQFNEKIRTFQSDGGGEFLNNQLKAHLTDQGIKHIISCPSTPEQNGLAERKHRHITELGLAMLFQSNTPLIYWVEAFFTANYLINLLPSTVLHSNSPHEVLLKTKPIYTALRTFGSACFPYLRPYTSHKFDPRSLSCVFLGYSAQHKGYRCLYPPTERVYVCRHVIFDEQSFPFQTRYRSYTPLYSATLLQAWQQDTFTHDITSGALPVSRFPSNLPSATTSDPSSDSTSSISLSSSDGISSAKSSDSSSTSSDSVVSTVSEGDCSECTTGFDPASIDNSDLPFVDRIDTTAVTSSHSMVTRSKLGTIKPNPRYILLTYKDIPTIPQTVSEAMKHPGWRKAMEEEIQHCLDIDTWDLTFATSDINIVGCRWVFQV